MANYEAPKKPIKSVTPIETPLTPSKPQVQPIINPSEPQK